MADTLSKFIKESEEGKKVISIEFTKEEWNTILDAIYGRRSSHARAGADENLIKYYNNIYDKIKDKAKL